MASRLSAGSFDSRRTDRNAPRVTAPMPAAAVRCRRSPRSRARCLGGSRCSRTSPRRSHIRAARCRRGSLRRRGRCGWQQVLLDLGGGTGRSGPADGVDVIGVGGRDRQGDRGFRGEVAQLVAGGSDCEQDPDRATAQLKRSYGRAGQQLVEHRADGRDAVARDLGPDRERDGDLSREGGRAGEALHAGTIEIDDVQRRRGDPGKRCASAMICSPS